MQLKIFVSHSSSDKDFCNTLVKALHDAGADVWYDSLHLGTGVLRSEIMRELANRPVFIVVLSKAAFASRWVQDECEWAYNLYLRKPERLMLPIVTAPYDRDDFDALLFIESMRRVEAAVGNPYPPGEAIERTLHLLMLTPTGETPVPTIPQPDESVDILISQGKALMAVKRYDEALSFFVHATRLDPKSFDAWAQRGYALGELRQHRRALYASTRALALDSKQAWVWSNKGAALNELKRYAEALEALDRALALAPEFADALYNKVTALGALHQYSEAADALDCALALNPENIDARQSVAALRLRLALELMNAITSKKLTQLEVLDGTVLVTRLTSEIYRLVTEEELDGQRALRKGYYA